MKTIKKDSNSSDGISTALSLHNNTNRMNASVTKKIEVSQSHEQKTPMTAIDYGNHVFPDQSKCSVNPVDRHEARLSTQSDFKETYENSIYSHCCHPNVKNHVKEVQFDS